MTAFHVDPELVDAFVAGTLDAQGEAALADQVAGLIPFHWEFPNPLAAVLSRITSHLGGEQALLEWLDRHPGRPRLVARLYAVMALLDRFSAEPAVVTALRELRVHTPYPPGLAGHLVPQTTSETLASLAQRIELLLGEGYVDEAVRVAVAAATLLQQLAPRAGELDSNVRHMGELMEQARQDILAATNGGAASGPSTG